ncbi:MAG TPA: cyclic nucleotide-binding domain-containing protein [Gaiellaceae bacterium]|nr:cyclic nucleotide-binding domain-containing protein [Gaiellaceae bacterium]
MAGIETLREVPLFEELDESELQQLAGAMHELTYEAGAPVAIEGASGDAFFVVESGTAEVVVDGALRAVLGPGDHFGEIALMQGADRTATVRAASELRCLALSPADFRDVVEGNPLLAWKVMQSLSERLE